MHTGWIWYHLPLIPDAGLTIAISLGFKSGKLANINLTDADPKYETSWNDWSEEKEHLRSEKIRSWLVGKGFQIGSYPWGTVWVGFDAKGGFGSAAVTFVD